MVKKIFNVLLVIVLVISTFSLILFGTLKLSISKNGIKRMINTVSKEMLKDESAMNNVKKELSDELDLDVEMVDYIMKSDTAQNVISEVVDKVISYNLGDAKKMTSEDIYDIANDNIDEIAKETGYKLTDSEKRELLDEIKDNSKVLIESLYGEVHE